MTAAERVFNPQYRERRFALIDGAGADGRIVAHGTSTLMRLPGLGVKLGLPLWAE